MSELRSILVVEDDPHIREVAELALGPRGGFDVTTCGKGAEAFDVAREVEPDLVLLDVMMPNVDGMEVLERLREDPSTASTPVAFLTARAQPDELEEYRSLGVAGVIVKPFDPNELPSRVREIWRQREDP